MKKISSKDEDLQTNVSLTLAEKVSSLKVRRSLAVLGFALSASTVGFLINQQTATNGLKVAPVATSSRTLTDVMSQNQGRKYEMARAAIASGAWDQAQGVIVHEVREDETLWKLTQVYQVDAAAIAASNGISANTELQPGTKLVIPPVNGLVHKVKPGDTLEAISSYYSVPKDEIIKYTSLTSGDFLAIDQPLVIPGNVSTLMQVKEAHVKRQLLAEKERLTKRLQQLEGKKAGATLVAANTDKPIVAENAIAKQPKQISYRVQSGDTIETIARRYGITQKSIIEANKLENPQWLELDQELKIPQDTSLGNVQTIAASNQKPLKQVPSPVGNSDNAVVGKIDQVRVVAATPMVLPKEVVTKIAAANQVSPWNGLAQLTGTNQVVANDATPAANNTPSNSSSAQSQEPVVAKVAASLLPFAPDQLFGEVRNDASFNSPTALNLPARTLSTPTVPAATATEQLSNGNSTPLESRASQPVAEPTLQIPVRLAAALSVPQIPATTAKEQTVSLRNVPAEATTPPASEPSVKSDKPTVVAAVSVPTIPSSPAIEQSASGDKSLPVGSPLPAANEPSLKIPPQVAANLAPKVPALASVEQQGETAVRPSQSQVALLPDAEGRVSSLEVKMLESEINQLNAKVREAEIKEAARKAEEAKRLEAAKIAAANLDAMPNPDRNFDASRSAIANPGDPSGIAPQLPQLMASAYLPDVNDYGLSTGFIWPADGVFTSGFGWRWGRVHQGIDIAAPVGTPILAAASGTVEYATWNDGGYGNMIDIRHADGTITRYAHMNELYVKAGQTVSQGQVIGAMGSTGFSTGPHLHFEIRPGGGSAIDPMTFLARASK